MPFNKPLSIDEIIDRALLLCPELPDTPEYSVLSRNIMDLRDRLAYGRLHIAVLGQFNRGKSTFINAILGMDILPVSVLPITSVPTLIVFGETNQCKISFSDKKDDVISKGELSTITGILSKYVTEKNNPKNLHCVSKVTIYCRSSLLEHGTVLIDTPGFGSTYTYNTQTTLDFLSKCDAALFLLSADLPITQMEIDFLKNVIKTIPRIFFIYNKIDMLSPNELAESEQFIKDTLTENFGFEIDANLFPVSVKNGGNLKNNNETFTESGLARIEQEIIAFLRREKYFTLSQALTEKFKDTLNEIICNLENFKNKLTYPLNNILTQLNNLDNIRQQVSVEMKKAESFVNIEKTALFEHSLKLIKRKRDDLNGLFKSRLKTLINLAPGNIQPVFISTALSQLFEEVFIRLYSYMLNELNRPLSNIAVAHIKDLNKITETVFTETGESVDNRYNFPTVNIEQVQVDINTEWKPQTHFTFATSGNTFIRHFTSAEKLRRDMFDTCIPQLTDTIDTGLEELSQYIDSRIDSVFDSLVKDLTNDYQIIFDIIDKSHKIKSINYNTEEQKIKHLLTKLETLIKGFREVMDIIV